MILKLHSTPSDSPDQPSRRSARDYHILGGGDVATDVAHRLEAIDPRIDPSVDVIHEPVCATAALSDTLVGSR
jgi:hypothetical protein